MLKRNIFGTVLCSAVVGAAITTPFVTAAAPAPPAPNPQMKAVLNQLAALGPKPLPKLSPAEARKQPGPPDAVKALLRKRNNGQLPPPEPVARVENTTVPGPAGNIPVRVYTPSGTGPFPISVYYHGGGWVIASIEAYDSSCRALANQAKSVIVSVGYRQAPEHRFPAAHEDSYAALQYVSKNAAKFGGDPRRVAVIGESAGGNLATATCLMARDRGGKMPIHQLLVYPITDTRTNTPSYRENAKAKPLDRPLMQWFFRHTLSKPSDANNKYLAVLRNPNLRGLPPATIITAQIDPLRSEGKAYADRLKAAGIPVVYRNYNNVTHEFFGMGAVVDKAKEANAFAGTQLQKAFSR